MISLKVYLEVFSVDHDCLLAFSIIIKNLGGIFSSSYENFKKKNSLLLFEKIIQTLLTTLIVDGKFIRI